MKRLIIAMIALVPFAFVSNAYALKLKTETDKLSYTIGVDLGNNFKQQKVEINPEAISQGVIDATAKNGKLLMTQDAMQKTLKNFQTKLMQRKAAEFKSAANKNKKDGAAFLAKNKKEKGVVTLNSGLQYKVLTPGKGDKPKAEDTVTVEYTGRLINGTVFDSTEKTGKPATFKLNEVIPGWTEALQLMRTGSTWEVFIPSNLGYGPRGIGGPIGPNETLIFKIRLISIKKS